MSAIAPHINSVRESECWAWDAFHKEIVNRNPKALDRVIETILDLLSSPNADDDGVFDKYLREAEAEKSALRDSVIGYVEDWGVRVTSAKIATKLQKMYSDLGIIRERDGWNHASNLLRVFKRMRNSEPLYLLPKGDLEIASEFIERLRFPPIREY
jgi:hypothetical protein